MTLIVGYAREAAALLVGDRLLTKKGRNERCTFDPNSNKQVLFLAPDGLLAIGYSGSAFIGNTNTDRWIAEQLCGCELKAGIDFVRECGPVEPLTIGGALETLQKGLVEAKSDLTPEQADLRTKLVIAGLQEHEIPDRARAELDRKVAEIEATKDLTREQRAEQFVKLWREYEKRSPLHQPKTLHPDKKRVIVKIPARGRWRTVVARFDMTTDKSEFRRIGDSRAIALGGNVDEPYMTELMDGCANLGQCADALADVVQRRAEQGRAEQDQTVGENCLSITMRWDQPAERRLALIRGHLKQPYYREKGPPQVGLVLQEVDAKDLGHLQPPSFDGLEVVYTPWIVLPGKVYAPCAVVGNWSLPTEYGCVRVEGPEHGELRGLLILQPRPRSERRGGKRPPAVRPPCRRPSGR